MRVGRAGHTLYSTVLESGILWVKILRKNGSGRWKIKCGRGRVTRLTIRMDANKQTSKQSTPPQKNHGNLLFCKMLRNMCLKNTGPLTMQLLSSLSLFSDFY